MAARDVIFASVIVFFTAIAMFTGYTVSKSVIETAVNISVIKAEPRAVTVMEDALQVTDQMDYVVFGVFIALVLGILITSWFVPANAIFTAIYFLVVVIAIVLSSVFHYVWDQITVMTIFGATITAFPITNNIITNLPLYMGIVGFVGLVVMFAKPSMREGYGQY